MISRLFFMCFLFMTSPMAWAHEANALLGKIKATTCIACHGADGNSTADLFPKLAEQHASYLAKELLDYRLGAQGGRNNPIMLGMATPLSDADIADISAYYASQKITPGATQRAYLALGQQLYRAGDRAKGIAACSACHGPSGTGNSDARFPRVSGQFANYTVQQLKAFRDGTRKNDPNHIMRDIAAKMTEQEMIAVASYISGLH